MPTLDGVLVPLGKIAKTLCKVNILSAEYLEEEILRSVHFFLLLAPLWGAS